MKNIDSVFVLYKEKIIDLLISFSEGFNEEILLQLFSNFEIKNIDLILKNSLKQLYFENVEKSEYESID